MKGTIIIVGEAARFSHKQNNDKMSPENLQVSTFKKKKKILGSIQKVFFLQRRRWITKTVNNSELLYLFSLLKTTTKKRLAIRNQNQFCTTCNC